MDPEELDLIREFHRAGIWLADEKRDLGLAAQALIRQTLQRDKGSGLAIWRSLQAQHQAQLNAGGALSYAMQQSVRRLT